MRFIIVLFWIIMLITEWYCWHNWHSGYFRIGMLILKKKIPSTNTHISVIKNFVLSGETNEIKIDKLSLRRISKKEVAIRNKHFLLWPVRGRMIFNSDHSVFKIQLFIDWFMVVLLLYIMTIAIWAKGPSNPVADILGLIGGCIMIYLMLIENFMVFFRNKK